MPDSNRGVTAVSWKAGRDMFAPVMRFMQGEMLGK